MQALSLDTFFILANVNWLLSETKQNKLKYSS